jgi:hypothetical protein
MLNSTQADRRSSTLPNLLLFIYCYQTLYHSTCVAMSRIARIEPSLPPFWHDRQWLMLKCVRCCATRASSRAEATVACPYFQVIRCDILLPCCSTSLTWALLKDAGSHIIGDAKSRRSNRGGQFLTSLLAWGSTLLFGQTQNGARCTNPGMISS